MKVSVRNHSASKKLVFWFCLGCAVLVFIGSIIGVVYMSQHASVIDHRPTYSRSSESVALDPLGSPKVKTSSSSGSYTVAPDRPEILSIPKLGVSADVLPMGITNNDDIAAPTTIDQVGWYTGSALPGKDGAVVIDGHASMTGTHIGVFSYISTLVNGDKLVIERGDHQNFTYTVSHVEIDDLNSVDISRFLHTYDGANQGLNLITCTGDWIGTGTNRTLNERVLVFAILQNS